jgi:hypothetical protein
MQNLQLEIALMSVQYQMITYFEKHKQLHVQTISISQKITAKSPFSLLKSTCSMVKNPTIIDGF